MHCVTITVHGFLTVEMDFREDEVIGGARDSDRERDDVDASGKGSIWDALCGIAIVPRVFLTSGKKHDSHDDYMDRTDGARLARLSYASAAAAPPALSEF